MEPSSRGPQTGRDPARRDGHRRDALRSPDAVRPGLGRDPGHVQPGPPAPRAGHRELPPGSIAAEVSKNLTLRVSTNYDARTDTFVESRFGADFKFQCWALVVEYINRSPEFAGKTADNEFRFSLNLLGVGGVLSTRLGASESGARLK